MGPDDPNDAPPIDTSAAVREPSPGAMQALSTADFAGDPNHAASNALASVPPGVGPVAPTTSDQAPTEPPTSDRPPTAPPMDPTEAAARRVMARKRQQEEQVAALTAYRAERQGVPPDQQMEVLKYAAASGLDPFVVEGHLDELKKTVDTRLLAQKLQASPGLAKFMANPAAAPLVRDDVANLTGLEWALGKKWEYAPLHAIGQLFNLPPEARANFENIFGGSSQGAIAKAFSDAMGQQDYILLANKDASGLTLTPEEQQQLPELEQKYGGEKDYGANNLFTKGVVGLARMTPYLAGDVAAGAAGGFAGGLAAGLAGAETGPGAAGTAVAGATAGTLGGTFVWNYYQNFGPQYRALKKMKSEDGAPLLSDTEARALANSASLIGAGGMTAAGAGVLAKLPGMDKLFGKMGLDAVSKALTQRTVARTIATLPLKVGVNVTSGGLLMASQAAANVASEELGIYSKGGETHPQRVASAAGEAFTRGVQDMVLLTAFGSGRELLHDLGQAHQLELDHRAFAAEADAAANSNLLDRSPEHFEELHRLAQGENVQKRWINADAWDGYWQGQQVDPAQMAARVMGDDGAAYAEAKQTGGDIAFPAEKFLSAFAKTEHLKPLADDIRFTQDGISRREARDRLADQEKLAAKTKEEAGAKPEDDGADQVKQDVLDKAIAAGVDKKVADATSSLWAAAFRNFGRAMGVKASDAYERLVRVSINSGDRVAGDNELKQGGSMLERSAMGDTQEVWHGSPFDVERLSLDKVGTGEGALHYGFGIYFGTKDIAEHYRDQLVQARVTINNKSEHHFTAPHEREVLDAIRERLLYGDSVRAAVGGAEQRLSSAVAFAERRLAKEDLSPEDRSQLNAVLEMRRKALAWVEDFDPSAVSLADSKGSVISARIPADSELLDWDKPLTEQPAGVLAKLRAAGIPEASNDAATGGDVYNALAERLGSQRAASVAMKDAGIPGARYMGDRNLVQPEHVIWDESRISSSDGGGASGGGGGGNGGSVLFQAGGDRGYVAFEPSEGGKPRRFDIHLLENADASTFAHESFHVLSEVLGDVATAEGAPEQLKADYQTLLTWMGHESHDQRSAHAAERRELSQLEQRTPEQETRLKALTAKEERATHAWEQYLLEGKSPSVELAGAFSRFKRWLTKIYRGIEGVGRQFQEQYGEPLQLSDDVRRVFDRLLTSEEEIARAQAATEAARPFATEHMTPEELARYEGLASKAREDAESELLRRMTSAEKRENGKFMRDERARVTAEVDQELDENPTYRTLHVLQEGDPLLGDAKLDRAALAKKYGKEFVAGLPRGIFADKGGMAADELAGMMGWQDGEAMVRALAQAKPRRQLVAEQVQQRLEQQYGPNLLDNPQELARQASDAVRTPAAARKAVMELNALRKALLKESKPLNADQAELAKLKENVAADKAAEKSAAAADAKKKGTEAKQEDARQRQLREELSRPFDLGAIKDAAERMVRGRTVGEIVEGVPEGLQQTRYNLEDEYQRQERKAAKLAIEAAAKGDLVNAIAQQERRVINQALAKKTGEVREQLERAFERILGTTKDTWRATLGKADPAYRDGHDAILQAIGLQKPEGQPAAFEPLIQRAAADGFDLAFDVDGIRELVANPKEWSALTVDQAENVADAVKSIRHFAVILNEIRLGERTMTKDAFFAEMRQVASKRAAQPKRPRDKALEGAAQEIRTTIQGSLGALATPETLITLLDNHQENGPLRRVLAEPEARARDAKRELMQRFTRPIVEAFTSLPKERQKRMMEQVDITQDLPLDPELANRLGEGPVTRAYLTMIALNLGNESNKQRLLDGYGWTEEQVMGTLNKHMDKGDWDLVQKVLDTLESMYPLVAENHERLTGLRPPKIEASPIETPFGTYPGGYFPAREDPRAPTGKVHQTPQLVADMFGESYRRPTVARGHTKERVEQASYYINLNWSVVPAHIAQVVHDLAYREYVQQSAQLLLDPRFRDLSDTYIGESRAKQFVLWMQSVANAQADSSTAGVADANRALTYVRGLAARTAIAGNLPSLAFHITDPWLGAAGGVTTVRDTAVAFGKSFSPLWVPMRKFALENSRELQARSDTVTSELTRQLAEIGKPQRGLAVRAAETLAVLHHKMDAFVTTQTWSAKYAEISRDSLGSGMAEDAAHARAVREADAAVRKVFPSGEVPQQSLAIRRKDIWGVTLMFNGFANKMLNLQFQAADRAIQHWKGVDSGITDKVSAVAGFAGTLLAMGVVGASGRFMAGKGKEGDEDWGEWAARTLLAEPFTNVPLLGPVADQAAGVLITGKRKELNIHNAPMAEFIEQMSKKVYKAATSGDKTQEEKLEGYLELLSGFALKGAGATQIQRTAAYARQLSTGEAQPRGPLDVGSGLIYGNRENQPANPLSAAQDLLSE